MPSSYSRTAARVEKNIVKIEMISGGAVFEVSVKMTKAATVYKRFDKLDHARRYRDMLLMQRDRLKKRRRTA